MGATYNDLYAAIGIHSGLACGAATDLPSALVAMRQGGSDPKVISGDRPAVPTIVFHGDRDTTVHPNNGGQILEQSMRTTSTQKKVHRGQVPGGHAYTRTIHDRRERARNLGALEYPRRRTRMVGRQPCGLLHRSARTGRNEGNAAFFPRAFAARGVRPPRLAAVLRCRCWHFRTAQAIVAMSVVGMLVAKSNRAIIRSIRAACHLVPAEVFHTRSRSTKSGAPRFFRCS